MEDQYVRNTSSGKPSPDVELKIQDMLKVYINEEKYTYTPGSAVSLESIGKVTSESSVYTGYGGNLYLYWRLNSTIGGYDEELNACVQAVIGKLSEIDDEDHTFLIGKAGICAMLAVIVNDEKYVTMVLESTKNDPEEFELLYGAAGSLYALGFILKYWPGTTQRADLIESVKRIAGATVSKKDQNNQLHFRFPTKGGRLYLGAAHGLIGILHLLLQLHEFTSEYNEVIMASLDFLLTTQFPSGNFPIYEGSSIDDTVHFCHGGPGAVPMLCLAYQIYNHQDYLQAALRAGEDIWRRGLLKKGRGICHGTAGNGYAFLSLFNVTGEEIWLHKAYVFAETMGYDQDYERTVIRYDDPQRMSVGIADHPYSLMEGLAGTICFFNDCLNPLVAIYPAYDI